MKPSDPNRTTGELKAVGAQNNKRLRKLLKKLGVPPEEIEERFDRIQSGECVCAPLTPLPLTKDQSSTT